MYSFIIFRKKNVHLVKLETPEIPEIPTLGTFYSHVGNKEFNGRKSHPRPLHKEGRKIEFSLFPQDLTVSRKKVPVYRCFTRF